MNDTTPDIEKRLALMMANLSPVERLKMASHMYDTARLLLRIGLQRQYQALGEGQLREKVLMRMYGEDFASSELNRISSCISDMNLADEEIRIVKAD
ncbi:MAG: hypothetical protein ACYC4D_07000 [Thermoleophilia bacterium]